MATLSLPGLAPFISEFLVLIGTFTRYPVVAVFDRIVTSSKTFSEFQRINIRTTLNALKRVAENAG